MPGEAFPLALTFDGQPTFNVYGMPIGAQLVNVEMPTNSSLITSVSQGKVMTAFAQGQLFQFNLNQTAQLFPSLLNCVLSVKKKGVANAGEFAVAASRPRRHRRMPRSKFRGAQSRARASPRPGPAS